MDNSSVRREKDARGNRDGDQQVFLGPQKEPVLQNRVKMGDREQQWCSGFRGENIWKSAESKREGRAQVLIFRGKLKSVHMPEGVCLCRVRVD